MNWSDYVTMITLFWGVVICIAAGLRFRDVGLDIVLPPYSGNHVYALSVMFTGIAILHIGVSRLNAYEGTVFDLNGPVTFILRVIATVFAFWSMLLLYQKRVDG